MAHGDETFNKVEFLNVFNSFRNKAFKISTIKSVLKAVGIIPFDPSVVFDKLGIGASYIEADPLADIYDQTPDHSDNDLSDPQTPKNLSALLQASYEIEAQYAKFVKGALACARESELLSDQLALTKATENA